MWIIALPRWRYALIRPERDVRVKDGFDGLVLDDAPGRGTRAGRSEIVRGERLVLDRVEQQALGRRGLEGRRGSAGECRTDVLLSEPV